LARGASFNRPYRLRSRCSASDQPISGTALHVGRGYWVNYDHDESPSGDGGAANSVPVSGVHLVPSDRVL